MSVEGARLQVRNEQSSQSVPSPNLHISEVRIEGEAHLPSCQRPALGTREADFGKIPPSIPLKTAFRHCL